MLLLDCLGILDATAMVVVLGLESHTKPAPKDTAVVLADLAHFAQMLVRPCVTAIVRKAQHDFRVAALAGNQPSA